MSTLVIKYYNGDTGLRPIPCNGSAPGGPPWANRSIKLAGGIDEGTAKVGVTNTVHVGVTNLGPDPVQDVQAEIFVCNFTLGVRASSSLASSNPGGAPLLSTLAFGPVASGATVDLTASWTPALSDASLNGGHVCIAANCFAADPPSGEPIETNDFQICTNPFHGQRNVAVRAMAAGAEPMEAFKFIVTNPRPDARVETRVEVEAVPGRLATKTQDRGHLVSHPLVTLERNEKSGRRRLVLVGDKGRRGIPISPTRFPAIGMRIVPVAGSEFRPGSDVVIRHDGDADVTVGLDLTLDPRAPAGSLQLFDLVQRDERGEVLGGARVMTLVTE